MYCIKDPLASVLVVGLRISANVECERGEVFVCNCIDEVEGVGVKRSDKGYLIFIRPTRTIKINNFYEVIGAQGKTLSYALRALIKLPLRRLIELTGSEDVNLELSSDKVVLVVRGKVLCESLEGIVKINGEYIEECKV